MLTINFVFVCHLRAEQTYEYTPPEALLNASWYRAPTNIVLKYVSYNCILQKNSFPYSYVCLKGL